MSSGSQVPAYGLAGLLLAAVLLVVVAVRLAVGLRGRGGAAGRLTVAAMTGVAGACVLFVVLGMRHYGGSTGGFGAQQAGSQYNCDQWYQEIGLPSGRSAEQGDLSPHCRHDAVAAVWPMVGGSLLAGLGVAVLVFAGALVLQRARMRRQSAASRSGRERFVDSDS